MITWTANRERFKKYGCRTLCYLRNGPQEVDVMDVYYAYDKRDARYREEYFEFIETGKEVGED